MRRLVRHSDAAFLILLKWMACHGSHQASDAVLELAVLGGIDERVDAAVDEHQHHREVVEHSATNNLSHMKKCNFY